MYYFNRESLLRAVFYGFQAYISLAFIPKEL